MVDSRLQTILNAEQEAKDAINFQVQALQQQINQAKKAQQKFDNEKALLKQQLTKLLGPLQKTELENLYLATKGLMAPNLSHENIEICNGVAYSNLESSQKRDLTRTVNRQLRGFKMVFSALALAASLFVPLNLLGLFVLMAGVITLAISYQKISKSLTSTIEKRATKKASDLLDKFSLFVGEKRSEMPEHDVPLAQEIINTDIVYGQPINEVNSQQSINPTAPAWY